MQKLFFTLLLLGGFAGSSWATDPTASTFLGGQIEASLLSHAVAVYAFDTHGNAKTDILDGLVQFGKYRGSYIASLDAGTANGQQSYGLHFHALSALNNLFNINPALGTILEHAEVTPRVSYDFDVHHVVYQYTIGAEIGF